MLQYFTFCDPARQEVDLSLETAGLRGQNTKRSPVPNLPQQGHTCPPSHCDAQCPNFTFIEAKRDLQRKGQRLPNMSRCILWNLMNQYFIFSFEWYDWTASLTSHCHVIFTCHTLILLSHITSLCHSLKSHSHVTFTQHSHVTILCHTLTFHSQVTLSRHTLTSHSKQKYEFG